MVKLQEEIIRLLKDPEARKAVATVDEKGVPHVVFKDSLTVLDDGKIAYAEELDSSRANKNMVRSIWFDKMVAVTVSKDAVAYQIKGKPYKCLITGSLFKQFLMEAREQRGPDSDIQSVWIITPEEVRDATTAQRVKDEEQNRPFFNRHLDRESLRKDG
jgi:hypothetical protein